MTLRVFDTRRPAEVILEVDVVAKKAYTHYQEFVGSLRLHPPKSTKSRSVRAHLYALNGDVYYGQIYKSTYGIFRKL